MRAHLTHRPDAELAVLAARGDRDAFGALVERNASRVRGLLRRMGADPATADDISQDTFIAAFQAIGSWRGEAPIGAWLCRIAARLYVKRWRKEARYDLQAEVEEGAQDHWSGSSADDRMDLDDALKILTPPERVCVSLCHGAGLSHSEAAELLRTPLGTVKSHVKRGLDKLKARLDPEGRSRSHG
jgi:RNA polymerase sigma-70 factor (ECF subfamily)